MNSQREDGYILASAMGALFAISVVAAALVGGAGETFSRVRNMEKDASRDAALQSAIALVTSELAVDPRRRSIDLDHPGPLDIQDRSIHFHLRWEGRKLDANLAPLDAIAAELRTSKALQRRQASILASIKQKREHARPIQLLADLETDPAAEACLSELLTVFGGQLAVPAPDPTAEAIGEATPGSRVALDVWDADGGRGLSAVVLMTGDPVAPSKILDWRRQSSHGGEICNEA